MSENFSPESIQAQTEAFDIQKKAMEEKEKKGEMGKLSRDDYENASQSLDELKFEQEVEDVIKIGKLREQNSENKKYDQNEIVEEAKLQARIIRSWAETKNLSEGKDYRIIEDLAAMAKQTGTEAAPHDIKRYAMLIHEDSQKLFRDFFNGKFAEVMSQINVKNKTRLDYSWGGRFCVCDAGLPCDTIVTSNIEKITIPTHHQEFKEFFKEKNGFDFPSGDKINEILKNIAENALLIYKKAFEILEQKSADGSLPGEAYGFKDALQHAIMFLERALDSNRVAVEEFGEIYKSSAEVHTYADLTYNVDDLKDFNLIKEYTGLDLPIEFQVDKIFNNYINVGDARKVFNNSNMEQLCKEFSDYLINKK